MKRLVSEPRLFRYLAILRINAINTWQLETAYFANGWGNMLSTVAFTVTFIVFISVIFANVRTMAGYTRDQMLFLSFIGQITYYSTYIWTWNNLQRLVEDVNRGSFDLLLVKPLPLLFYTSVRNISLLPQLRDGLPSLFFIAVAINWSHLSFSLVNILAGLAVMVCGQLAVNAVGFLLALPVFWAGQAADSLNLGIVLFSVDNPPLEGVPNGLRFALIFILPVLIPASLSASVILGKMPALFGLILAAAAAAILVAVKVIVWNVAISNYTSASS